jgi:hypothetical protein
MKAKTTIFAILLLAASWVVAQDTTHSSTTPQTGSSSTQSSSSSQTSTTNQNTTNQATPTHRPRAKLRRELLRPTTLPRDRAAPPAFAAVAQRKS